MSLLSPANSAAALAAISNSLGIAEFSTDGIILSANENFLAPLGYCLAELAGQHHSILIEPRQRDSAAYRAFWARMQAGKHEAAEFKRIGRDGREVWFQASYNPVLDGAGSVVKIIKIATEITRAKQHAIDQSQQLEAISRSQAVIEFGLDGTILTANSRFLDMFGYTLPEIQGRDHAIFVTADTRASAEHRAFWARLQAGHHETAEFKRLGKNGREIWLHASYNPILDIAGKPIRIIKVAADITGQKRATAEYVSQMAAIHRTHMVAEYDLDGHFLSANENFLNRTGHTLEDLKGQHHSILTDEAERHEPGYAAVWQTLRRGDVVTGEFCRRTRDRRAFWARVTYSPILDADGQPCRIVGFGVDTTHQRLTAANQRAQIEDIYRNHAAVEYTPNGHFITANEKFLELCGYTLAEIEGQHCSMMIPADALDQDALRGLWASLARGHSEAGEYRRRAKNGQEFFVRGTLTPVVDDQGNVEKVISFGVDITHERQNAAAAHRDFLTGLPNRMLMDDRLAQAITLARRQHTMFGLLFLDLDGFKQINDFHGHAAGDKLLQSVAHRLTGRLRQSDTVSRRGGDEFLILLPNLHTREDARAIAANLLDDIAKPYIIDGHDMRVTTSIGIALYPHDAEDAEKLIAQADIAMYQAKQIGRNAFAFYNAAMHDAPLASKAKGLRPLEPR